MTMDEDYRKSQERIYESQTALRTETDPAMRAELERIIELEMWTWN